MALAPSNYWIMSPIYHTSVWNIAAPILRLIKKAFLHDKFNDLCQFILPPCQLSSMQNFNSSTFPPLILLIGDVATASSDNTYLLFSQSFAYYLHFGWFFHPGKCKTYKKSHTKAIYFWLSYVQSHVALFPTDKSPSPCHSPYDFLYPLYLFFTLLLAALLTIFLTINY